jgi:hypothetical protein
VAFFGISAYRRIKVRVSMSGWGTNPQVTTAAEWQNPVKRSLDSPKIPEVKNLQGVRYVSSTTWGSAALTLNQWFTTQGNVLLFCARLPDRN